MAIALDRQLSATSAEVDVAVRRPGAAAFGTAIAVAPPQFIPVAFGPAVAVDAHGTVTAAWASDGGVFTSRALAAPASLGAAPVPQRPAVAAAADCTLTAWVAATGPVATITGG